MTKQREPEREAERREASEPGTAIERVEIPPIITKADEYDRVYRYLASRYHVLTPVTAFSGMAPQHGLVVAKVMIDADPAHGEVYQDRLFCRTGSNDPLDDEVAIAKVGLRKLALAGGWNLQADVLVMDRHYWVVRGYNRFVGLDGSVQTFSATEEYDLRDGSPQARHMTPRQLEAARAHGLRAAEARALNAACREYGIKQKYTRRELQKAFVVMRMMFIPDASNELQMRIVTERALQGTAAMFPQWTKTQPLEPIEGLRAPATIEASIIDLPTPAAEAPAKAETTPAVPEGYTLLRRVTVTTKQRRDKSGSFEKWTAVDANGEEVVTIRPEFGRLLMACWNQQDWRQGRPVAMRTRTNEYQEQEITALVPLVTPEEAPLPMES